MSTTPTIESAMRSLLSQPLMMEQRAGLSAINRAAIKMSLSSSMPTMGISQTNSRLLRRVGAALILTIRGPVMIDEIDAYWMDGTHTRAIVAACHEAAEDAAQDVILEIDSPGGSVAGMSDVQEAIKTLAETKRVHAFAHDGAFSASYICATGATRIVATASAMVGSIGAIWQITDASKMLADMGIVKRNIKVGAFKDAGDPSQPTTPEVVEYLTALAESLIAPFFESVAKDREISVDAVRAMEAKVFCATDALRAGLIDAIVPYDAYVKLVSGGRFDECADIETCADDLPDVEDDDEGIIPDDSSEPDAAARAGPHTPAALESTMSKADDKGPGVPVPKITNLAEMRAAHPDLCGELEASARAATAEKPATVEQLRAIAPGAELVQFREDCQIAAMTPSAAAAAYTKHLATENATLRAKVAAAKVASPGEIALAQENGGRPEALALAPNAPSAGGYIDLVKKGMASGMSKGNAAAAAAKANPEAHAAWLEEGGKGLENLR